MKTVIANWKSYKSEADSLSFLEHFLANYRPHQELQVFIAPSALCLSRMAEKIKDSGMQNLYLAAQNVSPFPRGGYTGEVSADLLKTYCSHAIVGHSERRKYFHESNNDIANKVAELADAGMMPILCVDDDSLGAQLASISGIDLKGLILAYTPPAALNSNIAEPVESVIKAAEVMKRFYASATIIYGGAVRGDNVADYLKVVDGVFVGRASHESSTFIEILERCKACL